MTELSATEPGAAPSRGVGVRMAPAFAFLALALVFMLADATRSQLETCRTEWVAAGQVEQAEATTRNLFQIVVQDERSQQKLRDFESRNVRDACDLSPFPDVDDPVAAAIPFSLATLLRDLALLG